MTCRQRRCDPGPPQGAENLKLVVKIRAEEAFFNERRVSSCVRIGENNAGERNRSAIEIGNVYEPRRRSQALRTGVTDAVRTCSRNARILLLDIELSSMPSPSAI